MEIEQGLNAEDWKEICGLIRMKKEGLEAEYGRPGSEFYDDGGIFWEIQKLKNLLDKTTLAWSRPDTHDAFQKEV